MSLIDIDIVRGQFGFGFTIYGEGPCTIESISEGSPAELSGLKKDDILVSINGTAVQNASHEMVINHLKAFSTVNLIVAREKTSEEELCAYCKYPVIRKVCKETHPQPTMLATVLYVGSMLLAPSEISLESIYSTVEHLHKDDHGSYEPVLMEVNAQGISVKDRSQSCVAYYSILSLQYCGMWPTDKRYFGLITDNNSKVAECHVFMTDISYNETFLSYYNHTGLTVVSSDGKIGHRHKIRVATHIVRGFASVYCYRNDVQVDQTRVSMNQSNQNPYPKAQRRKQDTDNTDTESVFYDCDIDETFRYRSQRSLHSDSTLTRAAFETPCTNAQNSINTQFNSVSEVSSGRISDWAKSFDKLLDDPDGIICFQEFLKKEYADENIKFWIACKNYELITDFKKRQDEALRIVSEYLVCGAPNPINIDASGRDEVVKSAHLAPPNLFKPMQKQIYNLMMYGKYWQFTRGEEYLSLLEQEKMGKTPVFKHATTTPLAKEGKRKNVISESSHRNRKFFSFFGILKRERLLDDNYQQGNSPSNTPANPAAAVPPVHHPKNTPKHFVLLEMPNCTLRRVYYVPTETVETCIEKSLVNSGINWRVYHVCIKKTGEVIDVTKPMSAYANNILSFFNTPTFQIVLCTGKKLKFCTSHGKTLKEICKFSLSYHNIDIRTIVLFDRDTKTYTRLDTQSILAANKVLEIRDITQRSTSVPRLPRKLSNKSQQRRRCEGMLGCSGSLESNLDLLSSVMESSDDEKVEFSTTNSTLVRSQSELEFFELLNRVQCDRLDNQRCSHPAVLKNISNTRNRASTQRSNTSTSPGGTTKRNTLPTAHKSNTHAIKRTQSGYHPRIESDDDIEYC